MPVFLKYFFYLRERTNPTTCNFLITSCLFSTELHNLTNISCMTFGVLRLDSTITLVSNPSPSNPALSQPSSNPLSLQII